MQQGGPALRALGLGELMSQHGVVSTQHASYRWDGTPLGVYSPDRGGGGSNGNDNNDIVIVIGMGGSVGESMASKQQVEEVVKQTTSNDKNKQNQGKFKSKNKNKKITPGAPLAQRSSAKGDRARHNIHIPRQKLREIML